MQLRTALPLLCLSLLVAACRPGGPPRSMGGEGGGEGQPTPVAVGRVEEQQIEETSEFMASLGSQQVASIRPQVSGQVTQVFVQLGSQVAAGAPLFEIDSRQQQAAVAGQTAGIAAAQANLESGRAVLSQLRADRMRLLDLDRLALRGTELRVDRVNLQPQQMILYGSATLAQFPTRQPQWESA